MVEIIKIIKVDVVPDLMLGFMDNYGDVYQVDDETNFAENLLYVSDISRPYNITKKAIENLKLGKVKEIRL